MKKDNRLHLFDIFEAIEKIGEYTKGVSHGSFQKDEMMQDAVIRQLAIIGESANRLTKSFLKENPDFPVREAVSMRNLLVHEYDMVNEALVWETIQNDLPDLKKKVQHFMTD